MDEFIKQLENLNNIYVNTIFEKKFEYKREIFALLEKEIITDNKNILLIGLRQVGKTYLIEQLAQTFFHYRNELIHNDNKDAITQNVNNKYDFIFYMNLKSLVSKIDMRDLKISLINFITDRNYKIIILDEIQVIENWSDWLQALIDLNRDAKFLVTGSNSTALKKETILNRIETYFLRPLNFNEYISFWNIALNDDLEEQIINEYLEFGSYPKTASYNNPEIQYRELIESSIIDRVISEDALEQLDKQKFYFCLKDINNYIGNEISFIDFEKTKKVSRQFAKKYIEVMINASLVYYVTKYKDKNTRTKVKLYYEDKSMVFYFANFAKLNNNLKGSLIENLIFNYLLFWFQSKKSSQDKIFYYRNSKNEEMDFVIPVEKILIEVKYIDDLDKDKLVQELNIKFTEPEFQDYKKIIINKKDDIDYKGWSFKSLKTILKEGKI